MADFGLTTEGSTEKARTTHYGRGTAGYRAPELVRGEKYTNKVDIFAIGCILYEIIFRQKAFAGDFEVLNYSSQRNSSEEPLNRPFEVEIPLADKARSVFLSKMIREMLNTTASDRPGAEKIHRDFISWGGTTLPQGRDKSPQTDLESSIETMTVKTSQMQLVTQRPDEILEAPSEGIETTISAERSNEGAYIMSDKSDP